MNPITWLHRRLEGFWVAVIILAVLAVGAVLTWVYWDWLRDGESGSSTVRNVGLPFGAIIAMVLAVWRSRVAGRQAATAQRQAEIALQQAATAERGLLNERYQKGAEMLGSDVLSVRLGGIYALQRLAEDHPEQYHVQIMRLFCAFARNQTSDKNLPEDPNEKMSEEVEAIMETIAGRRQRHLSIERDSGYWLHLHGVNVSGVWLIKANLSSTLMPLADRWSLEEVMVTRTRTDLSGADLSGVILMDANLHRTDFSNSNLERSFLSDSDLSNARLTNSNLYGAFLDGANLSGANLTDADLSGADFRNTNLSGTEFSSDNWGRLTKGLTQSQLDDARADPDNPPHLEGVVDAETGMLLVWKWDSMKAV